MGLGRILVVGQVPSDKAQHKNSTISRLHRWFDGAGIGYASFINASEVKIEHLKTMADEYSGVLALGSAVQFHLGRAGIKFLGVPHPSPRNRLFNDPAFELTVVKLIRKYVQDHS